MSTPKPAAPEKKGEVAELRTVSLPNVCSLHVQNLPHPLPSPQLLRTVNGDKDTKRKRDVLKKVIAYMTLGIDVSRLFPDMVLATNTKDLVIKKMVYLYLCTYAQSNPEMSLLVINTLQKDWCVRARGSAQNPFVLTPPPFCSRDEDPMIRGLALRALTSLRLRSILEYVIQPLKSGLNDTSGYVRQAAVVGVLKVFHISPELVKENEFVDQLYSMIRDREAQVVANVLLTLNEVLLEEGGIAVSQQMVHHLLNRIKDFSDWGQCTVIDLLTRKYTPVDEEELFGIMNLLDVCLKVANSAVVLGTTACFIKMTQAMPEVQRQVFLRLKTPLLTLLASSSPEIAYAVLSHVALMVERAAGVFDDDFKVRGSSSACCLAELDPCLTLPLPAGILLQVHGGRCGQGAEDGGAAQGRVPRQCAGDRGGAHGVRDGRRCGTLAAGGAVHRRDRDPRARPWRRGRRVRGAAGVC
jgi:vesicle coat complex subunit